MLGIVARSKASYPLSIILLTITNKYTNVSNLNNFDHCGRGTMHRTVGVTRDHIFHPTDFGQFFYNGTRAT
jgi:hypothetical protein